MAQFVQTFPDLDELKPALSVYLKAQPLAPVQSASSPLIPSTFSAVNSLLLKNLKFQAAGTYSNTLASSRSQTTELLTPFRLTGTMFQPSAPLTYEATLGDLFSSRHNWQASRDAQRQAER